MMRSPAIATACVIVDWPSIVMILPFLRTRSAGRVAADCAAAGRRQSRRQACGGGCARCAFEKMPTQYSLGRHGRRSHIERTSIAGEPRRGHGRRGDRRSVRDRQCAAIFASRDATLSRCTVSPARWLQMKPSRTSFSAWRSDRGAGAAVNLQVQLGDLLDHVGRIVHREPGIGRMNLVIVLPCHPHHHRAQRLGQHVHLVDLELHQSAARTAACRPASRSWRASSPARRRRRRRRARSRPIPDRRRCRRRCGRPRPAVFMSELLTWPTTLACGTRAFSKIISPLR